MPYYYISNTICTVAHTATHFFSVAAENSSDYCIYQICRDESYRVRSFPSTWPHSGHLPPSVMAAAGFFYINNLKTDGDRVACYKCGLVAESWI
jgi:hypothetical protein